MIAVVVLGLAAATVFVAFRYRRRAHIPQPALFAPRPHRNLEPALLVAVPGYQNMDATSSPAFRYLEEVRRRCANDFSDGLSYLEKVLAQPISPDPIEQAQYWADMARGLRWIQVPEAIHALLNNSSHVLESDLRYEFAAEVACFTSFSDLFQEPETPIGQAALRVLFLALQGVRFNRISPVLYAESNIGDAVRRLSENCPAHADPLIALVFMEALRHTRRNYSICSDLQTDVSRRQSARWQMAYLKDAEPIMREYLHDLPSELLGLLIELHGPALLDCLTLLYEMKVDAGELPVALLGYCTEKERPLVIRLLRWSSSDEALPTLLDVLQSTPAGSRDRLAALEALRGHPCEETERAIVLAAESNDPADRLAAIRSLGWWEPLLRNDVRELLRQNKFDSRAEIRRAAHAACARLGECAAIAALTDALHRPNPIAAIEAIRVCGEEGLFWLWPELDALTESDDPHIVSAAWEAIEVLRESSVGLLE